MSDYQHYRPMHMTLHERCFPHHVMEDIWIWSVYSEPQNIHYNSYLIQTNNSQSFIVDPVAAGPEVLDGIAPLPKPACIILTSANHERDARQFKERFDLPVQICEADASRLSFRPDSTFKNNDMLLGEWQAIQLPHQECPGECALYHPGRKILIVGDALIGKPFQYLSLPEKSLGRRRQDSAEGLRPLLDLEIQTILPGAGDPVMQNVRSLLADLIEPH